MEGMQSGNIDLCGEEPLKRETGGWEDLVLPAYGNESGKIF